MFDEFHMWLTFAIIVAAMIFYVSEKLAMEVTSILIVVVLLTVFAVFPLTDADGQSLLTSGDLLAGFANPALITIMALLIMAQGLFQSGALERLIDQVSRRAARSPQRAMMTVLFGAMVFSAFLNNTPVVLITIPILFAIAKRARLTSTPYMMGLSFITILGGMLTLIGSSTNLLVADMAFRVGGPQLGFFQQTLPGLVLMGVGGVYVLFIMPRLLKNRESVDTEETLDSGRQFILELRLRVGDPLVGSQTRAGFFPDMPGMTVQTIVAQGKTMLPPFDDYALKAGDRLFIAATRREISDALAISDHPLRAHMMPLVPRAAEDEGDDIMLAELVVAPGSRMISRAVHQTGFTHTTDCLIVGVQRRSSMLRHEMANVRLEAGDVLLVIGNNNYIEGLRANRDTLLMEWSARELPRFEKAGTARAIFAAAIGLAASGLLPIVVATLMGATAMVMTGVLNIRQARRGFDLRIFLVVAAALAMANALLATGGADFISDGFLAALDGQSPAIILSAFFLLCAVVTNVLSNNATAVLFTPLAVSLAASMNIDPMAFILAVIFAANCSFATPIAYQTNLLVMGPGNFQFKDFMRAGVPLIIVIWVTYSLFAPWYFGF